MLRSIRNVKLLKCVSLICLSPLFVFYSSLYCTLFYLHKANTIDNCRQSQQARDAVAELTPFALFLYSEGFYKRAMKNK